jgi:hypothetical protein
MTRDTDRTALILAEQDVADLLYVVRLEISWIEKNKAAKEPLERLYLLQRRLVAAQERLKGERIGRAEQVSC